MVRLAQDFALRYPLVEGQGNFGNIDGDNAAAYRYTEARLTPTAIRLMAGLDEGTVNFIPTYNGEEEEPEFPRPFPQPAGQWRERALRSAWPPAFPATMSPRSSTRR
jgi:topoisomerase-4 subunit A